MTGEGVRKARSAEPAAPGSAVWLREGLLELASALYPGLRSVVVREWSDAVRLRGPEPVGERFLVLVAVGGGNRPVFLSLDEVEDAFAADGWAVSRWEDGSGEERVAARREDFEVRVHAGRGPGLLTFTGWTPVVFTGRSLRQPRFTLSTVGGGVLCADCHGWGACLDCEGTGRSRRAGGWGRCWCIAGNAGPGSCVECGGKGCVTAEGTSQRDERHGVSDVDGSGGADAFRRPPIEEGHGSHLDAFLDVAHRSCACGEFRCLWRNALVEAGDHLVSRFFGTCQGCAARRAYAFVLPFQRLPDPPGPPEPPPCPRCAGVPVPLVGGLHLPGSAMMRALEAGSVAACDSGCQVSPDDPNWRCPSCGHAWRDADVRRRDRILRAILADVPTS